MGLSFSNRCYCDNTFGSGGMAPRQDCDVDHDDEMDCGTFSTDWAHYNDASMPCNFRLAVYDVSGRAPPTCTACAASLAPRQT